MGRVVRNCGRAARAPSKKKTSRACEADLSIVQKEQS
ncbi:hypothetical protein LNTAR_17418 [Lentisphaera araneosa HTCC2155]|uniref:Uncharacterized protein n=1 Tax=Lentisphaera araneosa HTCC2155 TaxID=313628 RepID=A6DFH2_9BACT|nr:hypothetical protein LNTAR_17418 [Lentisphaera araneosa HTCC2155]